MENNERSYYGTALTAISAASGLGLETIAVTAAALLGGVAGKHAGITDAAGSVINPAINLVIAGLDSPRYRRAQELLLAPITNCQQVLRDLSASLHRDRAQNLENRHSEADATAEVIRGNVKDDFNCVISEYNRRFQVFRHPGVILRNPEPAHFTAAMDEILDGCALIVYPDGRFLDAVLQPRRAKAVTAHLAAVTDAVAGTDHARRLDSGYGNTQTLQAGFIAACTPDELKAAVVADDPDLQRLLRHCIVLDVPGEYRLPQIDLKGIRDGYFFYQETVRDIFIARRAGGGVQFEPEDQMAAAMHEYVIELRGWLDSVPPHLTPFFATALSLPYKLLWTLRALVARGESREWCVPAAIHTTHWALERQGRLLLRLIADTERGEHERARATMLEKLRGGPCLFRDLLRRYRVQRRDVHQPILQELVGERLVQLRNDGLLELTEDGRGLAA